MEKMRIKNFKHGNLVLTPIGGNKNRFTCFCKNDFYGIEIINEFNSSGCRQTIFNIQSIKAVEL